MDKKNILVLAYAISPTKGSEWAVAWNYVMNMSQKHHLTVIYGISGNRLGDVNEMEEYLSKNTVPNVDFVKVLHNKYTWFVYSLNRIGLRFFWPFTLKNWNKSAYFEAKKIIAEKHIDVVHYLGPIGYWEPGYLWKFDKPYIWGPLEGTHIRPFVLFKALSWKNKIIFSLRNFINYINLRIAPRVRKAATRSNVMIAATKTTQMRMEKIFHRECEYLPENGVMQMDTTSGVKIADDVLNLVWIGRLDENKAIIILLSALAKIQNTRWTLNVVGDGPLRKKSEEFAVKNDINAKIKWHGRISRHEVMDVIKMSHLHILTSLGEANTTVLFETMSYGIPTMTLDHCGMKDVVNNTCGVKIPINNYEQVINDLSHEILSLIQTLDRIEVLSLGMLKRAEEFTQEKRLEFFNRIYEKAIHNFESRINPTLH